jgi:DNA polymerase V
MFFNKIKETSTLDFFSVELPEHLEKVNVPLYLTPVSAGFPSPAEDYTETSLDFNKYLVSNPASTFCVRVKGNSMINSGITDNDLLIVDKSKEPHNHSIVVAVLNGEFTVKRISKQGVNLYLIPENSSYSPILITETMDFVVWGVVTFVVKSV